MTGFVPATLPDGWMARREDLHARYEELAGLNDASRLGYLNGADQRWTEDEIVEKWREAAVAQDRRTDAINHVYLHVPFCKSICSFCNYERLRPSSPVLMEQYTQRVLRSLRKIGPAVKPLRWHTLYMGGGTASVLSADQLDQVLTAIDEELRWHPNSTRFFEFDPSVFRPNKLQVLLKHGFEHFSFGVQTLQSAINADHNRGPQGFSMVERRFRELREAGVVNISCDFLLGLKGTTPEQMAEEIGKVLALQPRWIDVYFLTPTREYVDSHFGGDWEAFWTYIKPFHERMPQLIQEATAGTGYRTRRGHGHAIIIYRQLTVEERKSKPGEHKGLFSYTQLVDQQRRPLHLLGLGPSARSLIFSQAAIECRTPDHDPDGDHFFQGHEYGLEGEVRLFLSHVLRDKDEIDRALFQRIFGVDLGGVIPHALAAWHAQGKLSVTDETYRLVREDRRERIRTLLWCVPDGPLTYEVERYEANLRAQARKKESDARTRTSPAGANA